MDMLSPALLQASFQSLLIMLCEYRLLSWRLEGHVNRKGDIYWGGQSFKLNNIGLKAEWQGIDVPHTVLVLLTSFRADMVRRMMKAPRSG